ncbi:MAG: HAD family hydrolase [Halobacteriales archaeon]|nr:HAD family hydrolase [Halobacteriales archaeon]
MDRSGYDFWLLDLDGTLIDIDPAYPRELHDRVGDRLGVSFSNEQVEILWHGLGGPRNESLREMELDPGTFWEAFHAEEDPHARAAATRLYPDAAVVADLDVPVGLVTHCQEYLTGPVLNTLGINDWFDAVVCCSDEVGWKPDPAPVRKAMAALDVPKNGATGVLVGDGPHDVGAAWNAGLDGIHIERHDPHRRGRCVLADRRIGSFDELFAPEAENDTPAAAD